MLLFLQTHACYRPSGDEYDAHRLVQAYELGQFVKLTSEGCDAVIIGGDFNFMPTDLGYKMIRSNANVKDAWLEQVRLFNSIYSLLYNHLTV